VFSRADAHDSFAVIPAAAAFIPNESRLTQIPIFRKPFWRISIFGIWAALAGRSASSSLRA
jgi:hypothetical protein